MKTFTKKLKDGLYWIQLNVGTGKERGFIIENLSNLVSSGVSIPDALGSIREEIQSKVLKENLVRVQEQIEAGSPAWKALDQSGLFSDYIITLVRIGENTERLSENLSVLAEHNKKNRVFRSRLFSAMMYPVLVLSVTLIIGIAIAWFILPKLATVFDQMNADLPLITQAIILLGSILQDYGVIVVPLFILTLVVIMLVLFVVPGTKHIGQTMVMYLPGFRTLITQVEVSRFTYLWGTLLEASFPIDQSLDSLQEATTLRQYKHLYKHMREHVGHGYSIKEAFYLYKDIDKRVPVSVRQMIVTGEQSGNLPEMLLHISEVYEEKSETSTKNIGVLLEPLLLVVVWLAVLVVALGVILPIYSLLGNVR